MLHSYGEGVSSRQSKRAKQSKLAKQASRASKRAKQSKQNRASKQQSNRRKTRYQVPRKIKVSKSRQIVAKRQLAVHEGGLPSINASLLRVSAGPPPQDASQAHRQ